MSQSVLSCLMRGVSVPGRAARGLYAGRGIMYGNNVSHSNRKTKRRWLPNVQPKTFHSDVLNKSLSFNCTTAAIRTIEKYGGIDNYLTKSSEVLPGQTAYKVKKVILSRLNGSVVSTNELKPDSNSDLPPKDSSKKTS